MAPATQVVEPEAAAAAAPIDAPLNYDLRITPPAGGRPTKLPALPEIDLNLTPAPAPAPSAARPAAKAEQAGTLDFDLGSVAVPAPVVRQTVVPTPPPATRPRVVVPEEPAPRPTLLGGLTGLADSPTRMAPNTDQATVPLIDFDLTGADVPLNTSPGRSGALTGSPMASQIATKLDLARGYIDLGVRDGARELLEEVLRDGTREQRQAAVELMKQIER
jgi:pilus assembly protein FimV